MNTSYKYLVVALLLIGVNIASVEATKKEDNERYLELAKRVTRNLSLGKGCKSAQVVVIDEEIYEKIMQSN